MKIRRSLIAAAISSVFTLAAAPSTHAESQAVNIISEGVSAGTIVGRIKEASIGASLDGAVISLNGNQAATQRYGEFRLNGVPPGRHSITVDYLGYGSRTLELDVPAHSGLRVEVTLSSATSTNILDTVVVHAARDAQAMALNQQRTSTNYKNVVSADLLGNFPDANIAESTQRIAGVSVERDQGEGRYVNVRGAPLEFTSVSVDGVQLAPPNAARRAVELDTIPSDVIAALEVTKALTPDMDGDAIAGNINIRTQSALDRDGPTFRMSLGAGQFDLGDGDNQRANATLGNRFGTDGNIGVLVSASGSKAGRFTDNVETGFFRDDAGAILPEVTEIKDYEGERTRAAVTGRFDYRINDNHQLTLVASASRFKDHEFRDTLAIEYERHTADSTEFSGSVARATFDKELRERTQEQRIRTFNLGGEHFVGEDWRIDWQASRSTGELDVAPRRQYVFRSTVRPELAYDYSNPDFPTWQIRGVADAPATGVNLPEEWYAFRRLNDRFEYAEESETGLRLDFTRTQGFLGESGEIKFGARARLRDKEADYEYFRNGSASDFAALGMTYSEMLCPEWSNNFNYFLTGRRFCRNIFSNYAPGLTGSTNHERLLEDSIAADYAADEDIYAAYVRLDATWDTLTLLTGVRFEQTRTKGIAPLFNADTEAFDLLAADNRYDTFLPSVHLRYEIDPDTIVRTSYSTAISRPNFVDVVPRRTVGENPWDPIEEGNPTLDATYAHNLDLSLERYVRPLGLLSVAAFYKRLEDPIFVVNSFHPLDTPDGPELLRITRPENGSNGEIYGVEFAWQQTFDFLPAPFDGFGIYTNYTYAQSSADLPFDGGRTELPGTSRHNYNVALGYEKYGLNARLSYNHRSHFIQEFNVDDPDFNVFWDDRSSLDFSASYRITRQLQFFGEINNLTDERQRRYQGQANRVLELEGFGRSWLAGFRFEY